MPKNDSDFKKGFMKTTLPHDALERFKKTLETQKGRIEGQMARMRKDDPFEGEDRSRIEEAGTVALEEEGHRRIEATMNESERLLNQIKKALSKIGIGSYGVCENCGKVIDPKRLEVFPMATLCMDCETKKKKK